MTDNNPVDTRISQARALIDDARTILTDLAGQITSDPLEAARWSLNAALQHLHILERSLSLSQCDAHMLTGGRCDLKAGHDGEHQKAYGTTLYTWTDESQARLAEKGGSRFD